MSFTWNCDIFLSSCIHSINCFRRIPFVKFASFGMFVYTESPTKFYKPHYYLFWRNYNDANSATSFQILDFKVSICKVDIISRTFIRELIVNSKWDNFSRFCFQINRWCNKIRFQTLEIVTFFGRVVFKSRVFEDFICKVCIIWYRCIYRGPN